MKQQRYSHIWSDANFEVNIDFCYAMLSYRKLGKPGEDIIFYQTYNIPERVWKPGDMIHCVRNVFTISDMIDEYQGNKEGIDSFTGQEWPVDTRPYIDNPYMILHLADSLQMHNGWLYDGYPEQYTITELKRLLGAYNRR